MESQERGADPGLDGVYQANFERIYRVCLAYLRNHEDAAEATQEVFTRALLFADGLDDPRGWLHRVARNHCRDLLRQRSVRAAVHPRTGASSVSTDDPESRALARRALHAAFASLTERERQALGRAVLLDRPLHTVADDMGVSYAAAAQLVSRARRRAALAASAVLGLGAAIAARFALLRERAAALQASASAGRPSAVMAVTAAVLCASTAGVARPGAHSTRDVTAAAPHAAAVAPGGAAPRDARSDATVATAASPPPNVTLATTTVQSPGGTAATTQPHPAQDTPSTAPPPSGGDGAQSDCSAAQVSVGVVPGQGSGSVSFCSSP
jgi:RNA polymerase sigma-70 factor, ECF subfamily